MLVIGLCGGSGSGKTLVQREFAICGIPGLDTDLLYHEMIGTDTPLSRELADRFGSDIRREDGSVDRARLADLVFGSGKENSLRDLNRITHAAILSRCREWLAACERGGAFAALINAPLLFESGFDRECDLTVAVLSRFATRILRIARRDGITEEAARRRVSAQIADEELARRTDYQLYNDGTEEELAGQVLTLCDRIKKIAEENPHGKRNQL